MFFPDDVDVVGEVRRRRHGIRQRRQISQPADGFELIVVLEPLLDREQIDRFLVVVHARQQLVNVPVSQIVKHFRARLEFLDADAHALVGRQQDTTEHALLGFDRMGRQAVHRGRVGVRRFLPARFFQIRRQSAGYSFNGIHHDESGQESAS